MSTEAPPAPPPTNTPPADAPGGSAVDTSPWVSSWIKPDLTLDHKALDRLPDHLKGMKDTLAKYPKFEDALVGWQNQQVMLGKKALAPLPPDAKPEAIAERNALMRQINGVPENPKDYGITKPADLPDTHWNQAMAESYSAWAHKHNVSPAAAKELVGLQVGSIQSQLAEQAKYETQFWAEQDKTFRATVQRDGIAADRADILVEKGAIALGLDLTNEQTKTFLKGTDARLMAMRHAIAIGEDKAVNANGGAPNNGANPEELANDVLRNPANPLNGPYWNKEGKFSRADHEAAVERVNNWRRQAADAAEKRQAGARR